MDLVHIWCDDRYWSKILHNAIPTPIHHFKVKVTDLRTFMSKFCVKVFRTSLFPNPMMDSVHVRCDNRYWSRISHSVIPISIHHFKVKVTDLELLCQSFVLMFLGPHCFQTLWWIWFMFGMMIDTGPKFYTVPSPPPYMTLRSRSRTWNFHVKVLR